MSFFQRFFKQPVEQETLSFAELDDWIQQKEQENSKNLETIKERKEEFANELDNQIQILKAISLDDRKADPRVKAIAKGNLEKYIAHLTALKENADLVAFRKAEKNYQKATLLVGKELSDTRSVIVSFAKFMAKNANTNLETIKEKQQQIKNDNSEAIKKTIKEIKRKQQAQEKEKQRWKEKREENKKKHQEEKAAYEAAVKAMKKNILQLKTLINFKKLTSTFHASKEMTTVKEYKENFEAALEDDDKTLIKILAEAKMSSDDITALIETIKQQRKALKPPTIKNTPFHAHDFSKELTREEKRLKNTKQEQEALKTSIKADLEKMGIILETHLP